MVIINYFLWVYFVCTSYLCNARIKPQGQSMGEVLYNLSTRIHKFCLDTTNCTNKRDGHWGQIYPSTKGMFTWKQLSHGPWESLNSHWLRVSRAPTFGLHEGNSGLQPITLSKGWKVYMKSHMASIDNIGWDSKGNFGTILEGRRSGMCKQ